MLSDVFNEFKSGIILSYGITNSGKTYTIIGNQKRSGLLPRFIDYIFKAKELFTKHGKTGKQQAKELNISYSLAMD